MKDVAAFQNEKVDEGTRLQIIRTAEELWNKSKSDLQLAQTTYQRIERLYQDSVVSAQRYDEVNAIYKAAIAAERAAHQQYLLAKAGAQKQDKESARSLVDAAQGSVSEVESVLQDAWLTAPMNGEIATIYVKQGELVGTGTPIMNEWTKKTIVDMMEDKLLISEDIDAFFVYDTQNEYFKQGGSFWRLEGSIPCLSPSCWWFAGSLLAVRHSLASAASFRSLPSSSHGTLFGGLTPHMVFY